VREGGKEGEGGSKKNVAHIFFWRTLALSSSFAIASPLIHFPPHPPHTHPPHRSAAVK
jgi:hypothetical protein